MSDARLGRLLADVTRGCFPPPDGSVTILPQPSLRDAGVIAFTAHAVIFTSADPDWVRAQLPPGDLAAPMQPRFLHALAERTGRTAHVTDMLTVAAPLPGPPKLNLMPVGARPGEPAHPRVERALRYRDDVRVWQADGGVLLLGRGVAGRHEVAIEVDDGRRRAGLGRALAMAARHLLSDSAALWAQISPGNAASVRAFLAAGFVPVGAESLLVLHDSPA
ncbi:MAG TPA: GNAT family N-acetyltransferase [Streptosporangiaceae bacterium]